ncbi:MAG: HAMP domain-containing sensor histidine kinase [Rhizomicrobium sp.]
MTDTTLASTHEHAPAGMDVLRYTRPTAMDVSGAHIAHEVNQPLAAILINANVAMLCLTKGTPDLDEAKQAIEDIIGSTHRASAVVRCVRDLIRDVPPVVADIDINDVIEDVLKHMRFDLRRHGVAVETELVEALAPIEGDRVQLERVVANLVANGIDAMSAVKDRRRTLRISTQLTERSEVLIAVEDTGTGVDPANIHRIFDPLFTSKVDGMGLGLSICRSIVEAHGGRLWATPSHPHGSVFRFVIPAASPQGDARAPRIRSRSAACMTTLPRKSRGRTDFDRTDAPGRDSDLVT